MRNLTVTYFIIPPATPWTNFLRFRWAINAIKFRNLASWPIVSDAAANELIWDGR